MGTWKDEPEWSEEEDAPSEEWEQRHWILRSGKWDDDAYWVDDEVWED